MAPGAAGGNEETSGGGWYLVTSFENVDGSITDDHEYDPVVSGLYADIDPNDVSVWRTADAPHGHVDQDYGYTEVMVSYCEPDRWYVRFEVDSTDAWTEDYLDYLAGENPTTTWGPVSHMTPEDTDIQVFARAWEHTTSTEVDMGLSITPPTCQALANTSGEFSTSHRMAWNINTQNAVTEGSSGVFSSHYPLSGDMRHHTIDIPNGYTAVDDPGEKMCVWVR